MMEAGVPQVANGNINHRLPHHDPPPIWPLEAEQEKNIPPSLLHLLDTEERGGGKKNRRADDSDKQLHASSSGGQVGMSSGLLGERRLKTPETEQKNGRRENRARPHLWFSPISGGTCSWCHEKKTAWDAGDSLCRLTLLEVTTFTAALPSKASSLQESTAPRRRWLHLSRHLPAPGTRKSRPRGGESPGDVRRLSGREYSQSFQGCSINLINGPITSGKHSSEIGSRKEEDLERDALSSRTPLSLTLSDTSTSGTQAVNRDVQSVSTSARDPDSGLHGVDVLQSSRLQKPAVSDCETNALACPVSPLPSPPAVWAAGLGLAHHRPRGLEDLRGPSCSL
ncbi:unnamed protein product [Pleuronectes platessa]|uniref:Uncharacterized protein n=1 Tax=Pleuronectes platessa TaxID=8262 RepID=A0A9N7V0P2_PLEPL|nr:unnamed protein product [Pleuronectes platessa]